MAKHDPKPPMKTETPMSAEVPAPAKETPELKPVDAPEPEAPKKQLCEQGSAPLKDSEWFMVLCMLRYTMGQKNDLPEHACKVLRDYIPRFTPEQKALLTDEINRGAQLNYGAAEQDVADVWRKLHSDLSA